ncbi:immunoglobulin domain-containing protein [Muricauda sp. SCSIO 64092]|uniref:immunoglobulin domain-containing protein n=1 Tax=Allomuricauda sp. SCSIO 64092 TaxID=2908842 RepID=UPI001FF41F22|nr:immunoglobulin domain-containing protein [Muricauda sp. SCSIO 64092]UOY07349.1 immunoglobulin domain-containing protein [Muricauda sp. SCSIO 64092]
MEIIHKPNWEMVLYRILFIFTLLLGFNGFTQNTFSDAFSSVSYSNNDGTQNFSGNWTEINDGNSPSTGRIRVSGNRLQFNDISRSDHGIYRQANLSSWTIATLSFDWQTSGLDGGTDSTSENLSIQASSDGVNFTTIGTFYGSNSGSFSTDISTYISSTTTFRFYNTSTWGSGDWESSEYVYIDNFTITIENDYDGDGIGDATDLDDDNDGITDEEEYCSTANVSFLASADVGERSVTVNHTDTGYLRLDFSSMDNSFQLFINGTPVHPSVLEFENGALGTGEEYFLFLDSAFIASPWVANSNGLPRLRLIVNESGQAQLFGTRSTSSTILEPMTAQAATAFNVIPWTPGNNNTFVVTNQAGPGPEGFSGVLFASAICDTDGDGISNEFDLDSDNDGIYDILESGVLNESGVVDTNNDGIIDGATGGSGSNGLFNAIEDNDTEYAIPSFTVLDSDSDGTYDPYSLDSDGDVCNDVVEAGFTDNNGDGLLGPLPVTVDASGLVTSGTDGYTTPDDNNTNSTFDFQETGSAPTITSQPADVTTCPGCTTTISATSTGNVLQWQLFNGSSWDNLSDSAQYSGTATNTLTIINPTPDQHNGQYRLVASFTDFICGLTNSNTALLTLQVNTVITNRRVTFRVDRG